MKKNDCISMFVLALACQLTFSGLGVSEPKVSKESYLSLERLIHSICADEKITYYTEGYNCRSQPLEINRDWLRLKTDDESDVRVYDEAQGSGRKFSIAVKNANGYYVKTIGIDPKIIVASYDAGGFSLNTYNKIRHLKTILKSTFKNLNLTSVSTVSSLHSSP